MVQRNDTHGPSSSTLIHLAMLTSIVAATAALSHHSNDNSESRIGTIIDRNRRGIPYCDDQAEERTTGRSFLYVTTLDGRLSALDIKNNGKLSWSIQTKPGPLISSSIHHLELTNNGRFVRMIPSLSGGIYKFDGETIDPIPITADNLLSSSAKFSDDLVISGGRETRTYGVSAGTGELLYECSINGCINATDLGPENAASNHTGDTENDGNETEYMRRKHDTVMDDIIVVRRQTQTVRAVETRTGIERWNFSVGQHELNLVKSEEQCHDRPFSDLDLAILDLDIRVIVPEGIICAYSKENPRVLLWKHKFDHPIVSAWRIGISDELESIDLFSSAQWLWENDDIFESSPNSGSRNPSIYLGMYEKQLYIQESISLRKEIDHQKNLLYNNHMTALESHLPKIPWRPIPASSNSLVIFNGNQMVSSNGGGGGGVGGGGGSILAVGASEIKGNELMPYDEDNFAVAQSVLNASEYVNGNGFYLFPSEDSTRASTHDDICKRNNNHLAAIEAANGGGDEKQQEEPQPQQVLNKTTTNRINTSSYDELGFSLDDTDAPVKVVILSLWFWWREIAVIAFTTALVVNILIGQRRPIEPEIVVIERHIPVPTETATEAILYHHNNNNNNNTTSAMPPNYSSSTPPGAGAGSNNALMQSTQRTLSESTTNSGGGGENYTSRFQSDFDLVRCLGRGGFGVVFEAKNKLDDCKYAVKRITLPNKKESRDRVMREVKTLANCEHHNIVRYFQAWVETPPPGWQEDEDSKWLAHEMSTSIQIETPDGSTLPSSFGNGLMQSPKVKGKLQVEKKKQLLSWVSSVTSTSCSSDGHDSAIDELSNEDDDEEDSLIVFRTESQSRELQEQEEHELLPFEHQAKSEAVAIDIHSNSIDLNGNGPCSTTDYSQLSDSFKIEFVRSTTTNGFHDDDDAGDDDLMMSYDGGAAGEGGCGNFDATIKRNSSSKSSSTTTPSTTKTNTNTTTSNSTKPTRPQILNLQPTLHEQNNNSAAADCKALINHHQPPMMKLSIPQNKVYLYIQMQLCRKESLRDWLREHKPDERREHIASIFHQIVDAVEYVHTKGLIHRDLKPSNIFFSQDGQIKIGDFGLVTDMSDIPNMVTQCGDRSGLPSCQRHTQQVGTHLYMSPEQLRGEHYDFKVDIYSLGLIFFELLVHFGTEMERVQTLRKLRDGIYPFQFEAEHPAEHDLLQLMLSPQPEKRPATSELKQKLLCILKLPELIGDGLDPNLLVRRLSMHRNRTLSFSE